MNNDKCKNLDCGVHYRVDQYVKDEKNDDYLNITYVGDYVVITTVNPVWDDIAVMLAAAVLRQMPPMWFTGVFYVSDRAVLDKEADTRWLQEHDDWDNLDNAHAMAVEAVMGGRLDLSTTINA